MAINLFCISLIDKHIQSRIKYWCPERNDSAYGIKLLPVQVSQTAAAQTEDGGLLLCVPVWWLLHCVWLTTHLSPLIQPAPDAHEALI